MSRILWKASDGREFTIDTVKEGLKTHEDILEHIAKLRKEHGYEEPTFISAEAFGDEGEAYLQNMVNVDINSLDPEMRAKVEKAIEEGRNKLDPKTLN